LTEQKDQPQTNQDAQKNNAEILIK